LEIDQNFEKVFIFSYGKKSKKLLKNVFLLGNKYRIHRFVYSFIFPIIYKKEIKQSRIIRGMQITSAIAGSVSKILYKKKVIINYGYDYGNVAKIEKKYLHALLFKLMDNIIFNFVDGVIVTTRQLKKKISILTDVPLYLIPNSINTKIFKPMRRKKSIDILYIGRLEKQKNLKLIIDAASLLKKKISTVFIGDGKQRNLLITHAKINKVNLKILSSKPHNLLNNFYNKTKIFILPSLEEGHPKALLEAMSCGVAVIGTNVTGIKNLIINNKNGILSKLDSYELSKKIELLLKNSKLRQKLSSNARQYIISNYNSISTWKKEILLLKQ